MAERDDNGRFIKGASGNPRGRLPKEREEKYYTILMQSVTFSDWEAIVKKAAEQAKRGDAVARKWLSDYLIGPPVERKEITGADGKPMEIRFIDNDDDQHNS